jgi:diaminopimelate epimerase
VKIHKYHSCENSFLIVDDFNDEDSFVLVKRLCKEYETDGLLVLKKDPLEMLVFNKDGSEAKMCGNGIRCLMHYIYDKFNAYKSTVIKTKAGIYNCEIISENPFISVVSLGNGDYKDNIIKKDIVVKDKIFNITLFELGVLHAVVLSDNFNLDGEYILDIFNHPLLSGKANIDFVKPLNSNVFEVLTYERGVGFTKACGTGVAASGYVLHSLFQMDKNLTAICPGGILKVDIDTQIHLTGESNYVETYEVDL